MNFNEMLFLEKYEDTDYIKRLKNSGCKLVIIFTVLLVIFSLMYSKLILYISGIIIVCSLIMMLQNPDDELERKKLLKWSSLMNLILFNLIGIIVIYAISSSGELNNQIVFDMRFIQILLVTIVLNGLIYFVAWLSVKKHIAKTDTNRIMISKNARVAGSISVIVIITLRSIGGNILIAIVLLALLFIIGAFFWTYLIYSNLYKLSKTNYENRYLINFKNLRKQLKDYLVEKFNIDLETQNLEFMGIKEEKFTFQLANIIKKTEDHRSFETLLDIHIDYLSKQYDVYKFDKIKV